MGCCYCRWSTSLRHFSCGPAVCHWISRSMGYHSWEPKHEAQIRDLTKGNVLWWGSKNSELKIHFNQLLELRSSPKVRYTKSQYKIIVPLGNADGKVRGQKDSSDTGFRAKFDIFKPTIPNTVCMGTLQISPPARESQSIQISRSRSTRNQSCFHCLWLHQPVWKWPRFLYEAPYKKVHDNQFLST